MEMEEINYLYLYLYVLASSLFHIVNSPKLIRQYCTYVEDIFDNEG
jgi:hypothetical protein